MLNLTPSNDEPVTLPDEKAAEITPLESLQKKFAAHKVTPVATKH
jgi:hypothetical protein